MQSSSTYKITNVIQFKLFCFVFVFDRLFLFCIFFFLLFW